MEANVKWHFHALNKMSAVLFHAQISSKAPLALNKHSSSPTIAPSLSLNKSSSSMFPSLSLNKPSSSITSKILNEGKISDGLPRAFVTLLAGKGDNIMGVEGLAKGLRMVKTAYPLVVVVLPGVPEKDLRRLESQGCLLRKVEPASLTRLVGRKGIKFSKLLLWDLDGYEKLVYLDFNVQVFHNIDELFDYPEEEHGDNGGVLYTVMNCFCEKTDNLQDNINLCQKKLYFDDGMFVFEPSKKTFKYLIETLDLIPPKPTPSVVQDFLNMFFKGVCLQAHFTYLQPQPANVVESSRACGGCRQGESRPLLCGGIPAVEVSRRGREHAERGCKAAGEEMVGRVQRRVVGLQASGPGGQLGGGETVAGRSPQCSWGPPSCAALVNKFADV